MDLDAVRVNFYFVVGPYANLIKGERRYTNYDPHKFDGIRNSTLVANNITSMYFLHEITFKAGLEFNFRDPIVG